MKLLSIVLITLLLASGQAVADKHSRQCQQWEQQLDKVRSQLRQGHKAAAGRRLRARKRELGDKLYKYCR